MRVGLVSCSNKKQDSRSPARFLYCSQLFKLASAYAEKTCDRWFILSSRHLLLHPDTEIDPYDDSLVNRDAEYRRKWGEAVVRKMLKYDFPRNVEFFMFAGNEYYQAVNDYIFLVTPMNKNSIHRPMQGLGIGKQLQWLKRQLTSEME